MLARVVGTTVCFVCHLPADAAVQYVSCYTVVDHVANFHTEVSPEVKDQSFPLLLTCSTVTRASALTLSVNSVTIAFSEYGLLLCMVSLSEPTIQPVYITYRLQ